MKAVNSLKGRMLIYISDTSKISIGQFLMSAGPTYLKAEHGGEIIIGKKVFINHNFSATAMDKIIIGDKCNIANNVVIVDHDHAIIDGSPSSSEYTIQPVYIGNRVWIGANVTILKGVTIGDDSVIAAGAVVNSDIPSQEIWGGVPAKKIKDVSAEKMRK